MTSHKLRDVTRVVNIMQLDDFGKPGRYLQARGWAIVAADGLRGTAACDAYHRQILVKPSAFTKPNVRVRRYVVPHEIWHGVHHAVNGYDVTELQTERNLDRRSAIEVVADGACLRTNLSKAMRAWVAASVIWHGRVGYRYTLADLTSPAALAAITPLLNAVEAPDAI